MPDQAGTFFEGLAKRGHEPALRRASGTVAIELANGRARRRWLIDIAKGDVTVSRKAGAADVTLRTNEDVFRSLVAGKTGAMAAVLRGAVTVEGDPRLLLLFRRLLPAPPRRRRRR